MLHSLVVCYWNYWDISIYYRRTSLETMRVCSTAFSGARQPFAAAVYCCLAVGPAPPRRRRARLLASPLEPYKNTRRTSVMSLI